MGAKILAVSGLTHIPNLRNDSIEFWQGSARNFKRKCRNFEKNSGRELWHSK